MPGATRPPPPPSRVVRAGALESVRPAVVRRARRIGTAPGRMVAGGLRAPAHRGAPRLQPVDDAREGSASLHSSVCGEGPGRSRPGRAARSAADGQEAATAARTSKRSALARAGSSPEAAPRLISCCALPRATRTCGSRRSAALGGIGGEGTSDAVLDVPPIRVRIDSGGGDSWPRPQRDPEGFVTVCRDSIRTDALERARRARVGAGRSLDTGLPRLTSMLSDSDQRVIPAVLTSYAQLRAPDAPGRCSSISSTTTRRSAAAAARRRPAEVPQCGTGAGGGLPAWRARRDLYRARRGADRAARTAQRRRRRRSRPPLPTRTGPFGAGGDVVLKQFDPRPRRGRADAACANVLPG